MAYRTMLLNRTVWSFITGLLTGLMILHFIALNKRCPYHGGNDDGRNARSVNAQAVSKRHLESDLHSHLEEGIPAKGTFHIIVIRQDCILCNGKN